jgi:transcriptional regulator with XRE-family HTH domain
MDFEAQILVLIGGLIKKTREERGLSQEELSQRVNLNRATICRIENGKASISMVSLGKIAAALNCFLDIEMIPVEKDS